MSAHAWCPAAAGITRSMSHYLLVDDRDGRILTELASADQAMRLLRRLGRSPDADLPFSVVRLDHDQRDLAEVTSLVSMRPLPPLLTRRAHGQP